MIHYSVTSQMYRNFFNLSVGRTFLNNADQRHLFLSGEGDGANARGKMVLPDPAEGDAGTGSAFFDPAGPEGSFAHFLSTGLR
jgi:hypothetical protein